MEKFNLTQTGAQVQQILNDATPQTDLANEIERAQGAEQTLQGNIDNEELRAKAAERDLEQADGTLQGNIDAEELRAKAAEQANADDIDSIESKIPTAASSSNQLADKEFVNSSIATATATYRGSYNQVSDLHLTLEATQSEVATALASAIDEADNNDYSYVQVPVSEGNPTEIAQVDRYKFNGSAWAYEYTLNNSGFTAAQWAALNSAITSGLVAKLTALPNMAELTTLLAGKQNVLTFDTTPTTGSTNPVTSGGVKNALDGEAEARSVADTSMQSAIEGILALIPQAATALNQLADKAFVNSSIATNTGTFKGTYNVVLDLELFYDADHAQIALMLGSKIISAKNNDYCYVQVPNSNETPTSINHTDRYKFNGTSWSYEYTLNNSGFTSAQWLAINSGITELLKNKLVDLPTATELAALLDAKQNQLTFDTAPASGSTNPVTSEGIHAAIDNEKERAITAEETLQENIDDENTRAQDAESTLQDNIDTEHARALAAEQGLLEEYEELYALYQTLQGGNIIPVAAADWPLSNLQPNVIYRVANSATPTGYSDYMYNGTNTILLAEFSFPGIDDKPTADSPNLAYSGGIHASILQDGPAFDLSAHNAVGGTLATYANLNAALTALNALPAAYKHGGMSFKYVQTSDNKYVQYRLMADAFSTTVSDWQGVDAVPTPGSANLVQSGGVFNELAYNLSAHNSGAIYASLNESLLIGIPVEIRRGGMEIKFKEGTSENNRYVQYRYKGTSISNEYFSDIDSWEKIGSNDECININNLNEHPTAYATRSDAISAIPDYYKKIGLIVTYYATVDGSDIWRTEQFIGAHISTMSVENQWIDMNGTVALISGISDYELTNDAIKLSSFSIKQNGSPRKIIYANSNHTQETYTFLTSYNCFLVLHINGTMAVVVSYNNILPSDIVLLQNNKGNYCSGLFLPYILSQRNSGGGIYGEILEQAVIRQGDLRLGVYFTSTGELGYASGYARSAAINIRGDVKLVLASGKSWSSTTYRNYVLYDDTDTAIAYGTIQVDGQNGLIPFVEGASFLRFSESYVNLSDITIDYSYNGTISELYSGLNKKQLHYKNIPILHKLQYINPSTGVLTDSFGTPYLNVVTTKPVYVQGCSQVTIRSVSNFGANGAAFRTLDKDGVTVKSFGTLPSNLNEICMTLNTNTAYYLQVSALLSVVETLELDCARKDSVIDVTEVTQPKELQPLLFKASNVSVNEGASSSLITNTISCRDWLSNIVLVGDSVDVTLVYGTLYGSSSIRISQSEVIEEYIPSSISRTYQHGLTLNSRVVIMILTEKGRSYLRLMSNGQVFEQELYRFYGTNGISITNNSANSVVVEKAMIDMTKTATKKVVVCGDSYAYEQWLSGDIWYGWTYILKHKGCDFANFSFPGATGSQVAQMLISVLNRTEINPDVIVYACGMNDDSDTNNTPTSNYLNGLNMAQAVAKSVGAKFLPCTIPSVPSVNNDGKNAYIKANYSEYVDVDKALTNSQGWVQDGSNWISGFLSSDNVHPTIDGHTAIMCQMIEDVPELFNY